VSVFLIAVHTLLESWAERVPTRRTINAVSSVKSFMRTVQGTASPASCQPSRGTSLGHGWTAADVIIARMVRS